MLRAPNASSRNNKASGGGGGGIESSCARFLRCAGYCGFVTANLCLVYVFECATRSSSRHPCVLR
jgi:hypothetical protein